VRVRRLHEGIDASRQREPLERPPERRDLLALDTLHEDRGREIVRKGEARRGLRIAADLGDQQVPTRVPCDPTSILHTQAARVRVVTRAARRRGRVSHEGFEAPDRIVEPTRKVRRLSEIVVTAGRA
jgi:hypothetical protein